MEIAEMSWLVQASNGNGKAATLCRVKKGGTEHKLTAIESAFVLKWDRQNTNMRRIKGEARLTTMSEPAHLFLAQISKRVGK